MRAYIAQIRINLRLTMRDRTVLFFNYLFPLLFFFIFGFIDARRAGRSDCADRQHGAGDRHFGLGIFRRGHAHGDGSGGEYSAAVQGRADHAGPILVSSAGGRTGAFIFRSRCWCWCWRILSTGCLPLEHPGLAVRVRADRRDGVPRHGQHHRRGREFHAGKPDHHPASVLPDAVSGRRDFPIAVMPNWLQIVAQFIPIHAIFRPESPRFCRA